VDFLRQGCKLKVVVGSRSTAPATRPDTHSLSLPVARERIRLIAIGHLRCRSEIVPLRERRNQFCRVDGEDKPLIRAGTAACSTPLLQRRLIESREAMDFSRGP
jgi:hypothetical protein